MRGFLRASVAARKLRELPRNLPHAFSKIVESQTLLSNYAIELVNEPILVSDPLLETGEPFAMVLVSCHTLVPRYSGYFSAAVCCLTIVVATRLLGYGVVGAKTTLEQFHVG